MTPYEIGIALHYYVSTEDHPHVRSGPPIWSETVDEFLRLDLLRPAEEGGRLYAGTERLEVYCEALKAVTLPSRRRMWGYDNAVNS